MFGFGEKKKEGKNGAIDRKKDYQWEGRNKKGAKVSGVTPANTAQDVKNLLLSQSITPTKVKVKSEGMFSAKKKKKILSTDITLFTRQISTMIKSGVALVKSLDIVADGIDNETMKDLVIDIKNEIESGTDFASALRKHPEHFDDLYCNLVEAAEMSGKMEEIFDSIAIYKEKTEAVKKKIKKALTYPVSVLVVAGVVTVVLLLKVVPQFEDMFSNFGAELPKFTQLVLDMSSFMQANWHILFGALFILFQVFKQAKAKSIPFNNFLETKSLQMPIFGNILRKSAIARFTRTLSTTQSSGVPLIEGLVSGAGATGNYVYRNALLNVKEQVSTGQTFSFALQATNLFPAMVIQMTQIGEESGNLEEMLAKVANLYEEEVDNAVENMTSLMEPMIMAFLGVVVGGLITAMYLPIFKMGSAV